MSVLIKPDKSVIIAADVEIGDLHNLLIAVKDVEGIGGIKVGFSLGLEGLGRIVEQIRRINDQWVVIYDHQKAGTDIPENGVGFARSMKKAGVDAALIFPLSGPETEVAWINALTGLEVATIIGGGMTHCGFLVPDGGFIAVGAPERMYMIAAQNGVRNFMLPGNKPPQVITRFKTVIEQSVGRESFDLYACGFIRQGGSISATGKVAGKRWHAIVGGAIRDAGGLDEIRAAAEMVTAQITS